MVLSKVAGRGGRGLFLNGIIFFRFSPVQIIFHGCNSAIIFHGWKFVFTGVIFLHFSREEVIFHELFQSCFHGLYQVSTGGKPKIFTGRHIFSKEKKETVV